MQVATITASVHSGDRLSGFDETSEIFRLALMELLKHPVCEMDTRRYHTTLAIKPTAVVPSDYSGMLVATLKDKLHAVTLTGDFPSLFRHISPLTTARVSTTVRKLRVYPRRRRRAISHVYVAYKKCHTAFSAEDCM